MSILTRNYPTNYKAAVNNGIRLLDKENPDWRRHINIDTLDVSDCTNCILGQLYGHYCTGEDMLCINGHADRYGFAIVHGDYTTLTDTWKLALNA